MPAQPEMSPGVQAELGLLAEKLTQAIRWQDWENIYDCSESLVGIVRRETWYHVKR